jgi:hypothetical protein
VNYLSHPCAHKVRFQLAISLVVLSGIVVAVSIGVYFWDALLSRQFSLWWLAGVGVATLSLSYFLFPKPAPRVWFILSEPLVWLIVVAPIIMLHTMDVTEPALYVAGTLALMTPGVVVAFFRRRATWYQ